MALTFVEATAQGKDAWSALATGQLISSFTYDLQEAPEIAKELIYGYRDPMIAQFLIEAGVGKGATSSDQNIWWEKGRLQNSYTACTLGTITSGVATLDVIDTTNDIRVGQTLLIGDNAANLVDEVYVSAVSGKDITVNFRTDTPLVLASTTDISVMHLASDFKQGTGITDSSVGQLSVKRTNNPIIVKDYANYDRSTLKQIVQFSNDMTMYTLNDKDMDTRFDLQQIMAGIFGKASESSSAAVTFVDGTESVTQSVINRGNTVSGTFATKADLESYVKTLNSVKGSKTNQLLLDLTTIFELDNVLGAVDGGYSGGSDFGAFDESIDYRKLGFSSVNLQGWNTAYKHWDILDDTSYFGVFEGNASKIKGMSIPQGQVQLAGGGSTNYLSFLYRDGMDKVTAKVGNVVGNSHVDGLSISCTTELTPKAVSAKDFILFQ